jgi:two-component system, chemotaxis family, chemotaxis protein CheY
MSILRPKQIQKFFGKALRHASIGMKGSAQNGRGDMRVLIADDQKSVGTTLATLVSHCNHQVVEVVGSGFEAIQAYTRHHPDLVLMDYWMSRLNGATACRNILARDPSARVILVSGWSPATELSSSGAMAVLSKPVHLERLAEILDYVERQPVLDLGPAGS